MSHRRRFGFPEWRQTLQAVASAFVALWLAGCGTSALIPEKPEDRGAGTPISRSPHMRTGSLTYRLGQLARTEEGVRIDFTLQNGSSRQIEQGLLRVIVIGPDGRELSARLPFVGLRAGQSRVLVARFGEVPFRVQDFVLEVIFVVP